MSMFFLPFNEPGSLPANKLPDETIDLLVRFEFEVSAFPLI